MSRPFCLQCVLVKCARPAFTFDAGLRLRMWSLKPASGTLNVVFRFKKCRPCSQNARVPGAYFLRRLIDRTALRTLAVVH